MPRAHRRSVRHAAGSARTRDRRGSGEGPAAVLQYAPRSARRRRAPSTMAIAAALDRSGFTGYGGWLHVDGAWAGSAFVCPELRGPLAGIEAADSFAVNPHKWLLVNFDCDAFYTRDREALLAALSVTPEYLRNAASGSGAVIDYRDWQIPLGRRFRALKLWFVMRHYGAEGLRAHIRKHVRMAEDSATWVAADGRFEVISCRPLAGVHPARAEGRRDAGSRGHAQPRTARASERARPGFPHAYGARRRGRGARAVRAPGRDWRDNHGGEARAGVLWRRSSGRPNETNAASALAGRRSAGRHAVARNTPHRDGRGTAPCARMISAGSFSLSAAYIARAARDKPRSVKVEVRGETATLPFCPSGLDECRAA